MKVTTEQLMRLVAEEIENLDPDLQEGIMDYFKGAGGAAGSKASSTASSVGSSIANRAKSVASGVGNAATSAKNKVGQVAGDIKNAGATSSLKADVQKAIQQSGVQVQTLMKTFRDLLARAQSLRLSDEEQQIKSELQALQTYQETAAAGLGSGDGMGQPKSLDSGSPATSSPIPSLDQMNGETPVTPTPSMSKPSPSAVNLPPKASPAGVSLPPKPSPKPVGMPPESPFDWRSDKARLPSSISSMPKTIPSPVSMEPPAAAPKPTPVAVKKPSPSPAPKKPSEPAKPAAKPVDKPAEKKADDKKPVPSAKKAIDKKEPEKKTAAKPKLKTKLDKSNVTNVIKKHGSNFDAASKELGISKDKMIAILGQK